MFNDYQLAYHPSVDQSDVEASGWKVPPGRMAELRDPSGFVMWYAPPAQIWPWGHGASTQIGGKVFRWHKSGRAAGSRTYENAGLAPFYSNISFMDAHAETVDFTGTYKRNSSGTIVGQDRRATGPVVWYLYYRGN